MHTCSQTYMCNIPLSADEWKKYYSKCIIHNDIKENNDVIQRTNSETNSVLIDLGKRCFVSQSMIKLINDCVSQPRYFLKLQRNS